MKHHEAREFGSSDLGADTAFLVVDCGVNDTVANRLQTR